jgi:hypothetical protein
MYGNFNGGRFRVWENGLFSAGEFIGSATLFSTCGTSSGSIAPGNADNLKMDLSQIIMDFGEMV